MVLNYSFCGVKIQLPEGSLPYPGHRLEESGAYYVPLEKGISLAPTALDVRQNPSRGGKSHFYFYGWRSQNQENPLNIQNLLKLLLS